ncbi:MAG: Deoxyuridine 5'-triphosphate nucleotidohydrolase [Candidatus Moranbacteria bacterium GW2011_GWF2_34_56]|nr:MAG: Deoxyuridine 5'-triphosphate nucleotidohydrolase [Candidatus Moranbacteria bacterium GW2011_GWF1_34_10]KKP65413.1 MAG: Deoxyuridine 5'-triphosphate nucleotidohydrolase [Candidatus Moranbacteria bacterium GW2011_GWF2_34_56]HBI16621.1 dUTP diphosphatase [Candidatus Moranbacteria bacterium]
MKIQIKKINPEAKIPIYAIKDDAGMELYSVEDLIVESGKILACGTGISVAIPTGYVGLIWDKSGVAFKGGIKTMGGVIDSSYRGEIKIILTNLSDKEYVINKGEKVAQMLIQKVEIPAIEEVQELDNTERGEGRFGSTGIK